MAYWLAQKYHQHPNAFLTQPLSDIARHVARANELAELVKRESADGQ